MGEVYRARDTKSQRDVALKILPEAMARDAQRMARFECEAQVLEMRFFGGLSVDEIAEVVKLSLANVVRNWNTAKAWLDSTSS